MTWLTAVGTAALLLACLQCSRGSHDVSAPTERATTAREPSTKAAEAGTKTAPAPHDDEAEQHEELPTKVRLSPAVARSAGIKTAAAVLDNLPATVDLTGEIAADPDRSARLAARIAGRIVDVRVKEGDRVKAGQTIAVLESPSSRIRARTSPPLLPAPSRRG